MELRYLGTAMVDLRVGDARFLTDPVLDPRGTAYDLGPWYAPRAWFASEKQYETPHVDGAFDAALVSHDQHADNLDLAGRALIADADRVARVITTPAGAKRLARPRAAHDAPGKGLALGDRAVAIAGDASVRVGRVTVRPVVARHGPAYVPQVHEVTGFVLDVDAGPRIWISGDTVLFPALATALAAIAAERPVDVAIVHCGAVAFPRALGVGRARFTFDAAEAIEACTLVGARTIVPIHRGGWAHFRQSEDALAGAFAASPLADRVRMLALGETFSTGP